MRPFEQIVTEYGPMVLRVCRAILGPVDADDAWSETFLSALTAYPRLDETRTSKPGWSRSRTARRSTRPGPGPAGRWWPGIAGTAPPDFGPARRPARGAGTASCGTALRELPDKQRQVVAYHYLAGLPYAEIAAIVGGTADAARRAAADGIGICDARIWRERRHERTRA